MSAACISGYVWLAYHIWSDITSSESAGVCLIKNVLHIPCPSCGVTRSVLLLLQGDIYAALMINPLGILISIGMLILPAGIITDLLTGRTYLHTAYQYSEKLLRRKYIAFPLILLVLLNWIWNITKDI